MCHFLINNVKLQGFVQADIILPFPAGIQTPTTLSAVIGNE